MEDSKNSNAMKLMVFLTFIIMGLLLSSTITPSSAAAAAAAAAADEFYVATVLNQSTGRTMALKPAGPTEYRPLTEVLLKLNGDHGNINNDDTEIRRRLTSPYQLCLVCKCCSATTCTSMPCCFVIDCQLPGKPFGVCAFVPKICNCTNCATNS